MTVVTESDVLQQSGTQTGRNSVVLHHVPAESAYACQPVAAKPKLT